MPTPELRKHGNRLSVPVKNEYCCVEYPTQRIEDVHVGRLGEAERRERRLHARSWIPQEIQILYGAGRTANLQRDTMASKY